MISLGQSSEAGAQDDPDGRPGGGVGPDSLHGALDVVVQRHRGQPVSPAPTSISDIAGGRATPGPSLAAACQPLHLAQLAFQQQPEGRHVSVELAHRVFGPFPHQVLVQFGAVDDPGRLPMRVAHDHRGFLFRLDPQIGPELLGGNQRSCTARSRSRCDRSWSCALLSRSSACTRARVSRSTSSASGLELVHLGSVVAPERADEVLGPARPAG